MYYYLIHLLAMLLLFKLFFPKSTLLGDFWKMLRDVVVSLISITTAIIRLTTKIIEGFVELVAVVFNQQKK